MPANGRWDLIRRLKVKQHSAAEISKLSATLGDLEAKLVAGTSDNHITSCSRQG